MRPELATPPLFAAVASGSELNGIEFPYPLAQFPERQLLDLPDPFACHAELLADFLQCFPVVTVEPEPLPEDRLLSRVQGPDHFVDERVVRL